MRHRVCVGVDGTRFGDRALRWAAQEAVSRRAELRLVHAWHWEADWPPIELDASIARDTSRQVLAEAERWVLGVHPDLLIGVESVTGRPRDALSVCSADCELIVVGCRGAGGFPALLVGSTALHLAAQSAVPVVVVHGSGAGTAAPGGRTAGIVVGVPGRDHSEAVLSYAFEEAARRRLPLLAVHAWSVPLLSGPGIGVSQIFSDSQIEEAENRLLAEVLAGWQEKYPQVPVGREIVRTGASRRLVELSRSAESLVVGRRGTPAGPLGRLGSVSQAVVQYSACPVAVVPL